MAEMCEFASQIIEHICSNYGAEPEHPWASSPESAVFRHASNKKWFALYMRLERALLKLEGEGKVDVINLKCDPITSGSFRSSPGVLPGYHMNKQHWITVLLDGTLPREQVIFLLDISYDLTDRRKK